MALGTKKRKSNVVDTTAELRAQMKKNGVRLPHGYEVTKRKATPKKKTVGTAKPKAKKGATALKKITARAKQIQKKFPSMSWTWCIKSASREYNQNK